MKKLALFLALIMVVAACVMPISAAHSSSERSFTSFPKYLYAAASLLTILPNGDGSVTVKASIANGVKGFWYSLVASDDLAAWKAVASGEYDSGTPSEQALQTQPVELSIDVTPADAKKFYKIVVTVKNPVTE